MWASFYLCEMRHLLGGPERGDITSQLNTKSLNTLLSASSTVLMFFKFSKNCFKIKFESVCLVGSGAGSVGRRAGFGDGSATAGERRSGAT